MTKIFKTRGIILGKNKFQLDLLVYFLTANGIIRIKAKSVLKSKAKLRGIIELFDVSYLELIHGKKDYILIGGKLIRRPLYLRKNLEKSLFLMALAEITLAIVKGEESNNVFRFWLFVLQQLKEINDNDLLPFFASVLGHLLFLEGLIDKDSNKIFHLEGQFLVDLFNLPFSKLLTKNYTKTDYLNFIKAAKSWLQGEGVKFLTFDLFLGKINK